MVTPDLEPSNTLDLGAPQSDSPELTSREQSFPPNLFVLPSTGPVVYPTLLAPLLISQPRFVAMIEEAINRQRLIGMVMTTGGDILERTKREDLANYGVIVKIIKRLRMPDGSVNLLIHSLKRFKLGRLLSAEPYIVVEAEYLDDQIEKSTEFDALSRTVVSHVKKLSEVNPFFTDEMRLAMLNAPGPGTIADLVAFSLTLPRQESQDFLETLSVKTRFEKLLVHLRREQDLADLQRKITDEVNTKINKLQREFFLKEQMKAIKREIGVEMDAKEQAVRALREKLSAARLPEDAQRIALEELEKFELLAESSPEYHVLRTYLETLVSLPWSIQTTDLLNLAHAREVLDAQHYGLEKVKERIIEFLAVRKLNPASRASIICLVGPPGVGKTSLGKSIAQSLDRKFYRFSLGGMRDEAEIKGHRRTYVGALPGKIIQGLKRAGSKNPVMLLDEIDKISKSTQGDPASALLEVLDPEQNSSFLDHYLDIPFDLSHVLFITTANTTATIPPPLLDRMEVIELSGYTLQEKHAIALDYVIPRERTSCNLQPKQLSFTTTALRRMMTDYAREPGLRSLQMLIGQMCRKVAARVVHAQEAGAPEPTFRINRDDLPQWIGPPRFYNEIAERLTDPGVVIGLAWTSMGGDVLFLEATTIPGKGRLKLTGQLGAVMTESAEIAWSYVKRRLHSQDPSFTTRFQTLDVHLHLPAGAIPKDGPSAGITLACALYSLATGRKSKYRLAMTGELTLKGKVFPVGGIKEKVLAAKRSGVQQIILPALNAKDVVELPAYALAGIKIHYVKHVEEVFALALETLPTKMRSALVKRARVALGAEA